MKTFCGAHRLSVRHASLSKLGNHDILPSMSTRPLQIRVETYVVRTIRRPVLVIITIIGLGRVLERIPHGRDDGVRQLLPHLGIWRQRGRQFHDLLHL